MSHFTVLVIGEDADKLMAPFDENGEWFADGSKWDWYVVGGRWTGTFDPSYDSDKDPRNYSECRWCAGTGVTTRAIGDEYPAYKEYIGKPCIQCAVGHDGEEKPFPGRERNYQNVEHASDVTTVDAILKHKVALLKDDWRVPTFAVITPDGTWHERGTMGWFGMTQDEKDKDQWEKMFWSLLEKNRGNRATLMDAHV